MIMMKFKIVYDRGIMIFLLFLLATLFHQCKDPASLSAVIITDAENQVSSDLQTILENTGLFDVDISGSGTPSFSNYDVVVLHLKKADWTDQAKNDFVSYVNGGGGVVVLAESALAFGNWTELNKIVGISTSSKAAISNEAFEYELVHSKEKSPINEGLNDRWIHAEDYLSFNTSTLLGDTEILATALADTIQGGNGAYLPVVFTVNYGEGKVFHSTLGIAASHQNLGPLQCVGFITTLQRGAEWAATGVVSQEAPIDFPNSASTHEWTDYKPLQLDEILNRSKSYEVGKSKKYLSDFSMRIRNCDGKAETYAQYEDMILDFLSSDATVDSKKYMCRELSWMGSEKSIAALEKLVNDKDLSESASYALQRLRL
jgi:type 1 glutamine amidotransferase